MLTCAEPPPSTISFLSLTSTEAVKLPVLLQSKVRSCEVSLWTRHPSGAMVQRKRGVSGGAGETSAFMKMLWWTANSYSTS